MFLSYWINTTFWAQVNIQKQKHKKQKEQSNELHDGASLLCCFMNTSSAGATEKQKKTYFSQV